MERPVVTSDEATRVVSGDGAASNGTPPPALPAVAPTCKPADLYVETTGILRRVAQVRQRPLFVLVSSFIDEDVCDAVFAWRKHLREAGRGDNLDILVHSPGGDLTACYQTARLFARYTNAWEALVPRFAASGATLVCLGSSKIVLSGVARLGPMDPQVISKRAGKFFAVERQSPLEAFRAVRYLQEVSLEALNSYMVYLLRKQGIAPQPALEAASQMAIQLVQPISEKIDPYDIGAFALDSDLATNYCRRVCDPAEGDKKTQRTVEYRSLVERYPAHEFVIDLSEADTLGLNVEEAPEALDDLFDELKPCLDELETYIGLVPANQEDEP